MSSSASSTRNCWTLLSSMNSTRREDPRALGEVGVDLLHLGLGALDGTDVVDPRRDLRRDRRVVVVVHQRLGVARCVEVIGTIMLSDQSVPPDSGQGERPVGVLGVGGEDEDVAAPRDAGDRVAAGEVLHVGVALHLADVAVVDLLLDEVERLLELRLAPVARRCRRPGDCMTRPAVSRNSREHDDAALEVVGPQVVEGLQLATDLLLVVADAREAALPGDRVRRPGSKETSLSGCRRLLTALGIWISSSGWTSLVADEPGRHPVGQRDDVAVDVLTGAQLRADLGVVGVVVVDRPRSSRPRCPSAR